MFSFVIPFHADYQRVIPTLSILLKELDRWSVSEILLCHNGPAVEALEVLKSHAASNVKLLHTPDKGIGAAYRLGIINASAPYVVLSASDIPFGFSDIESFMQYKNLNGDYPQFAVGSKFHPDSDIRNYPLNRRIYSRLFYFARLLILGGSTPKDSQGTLLGSTELMRKYAEQVSSRDYFFSLELLTAALSGKTMVVELPVTLLNHDQESSVAPMEDGISMLSRLMALRKKFK